MAKYCFKIYLKDETAIKWSPSNLEETDLHNMDMYVLNGGGYSFLLSKISNELGILESSISKVTILRIKKEIEFSLVNHNLYLKDVYPYLKKKKINGYNNHLIDATVISSDCKAYQEMKDYLFENIRGNFSDFLQNVYTYDNEFSRILYRYGGIYHQASYNEEDIRNISELERKIETELSIYKNYRGLSICRQKNRNGIGKYVFTSRGNSNKGSAINIKVVAPTSSQSLFSLHREFPTIAEKVAEYNEEYEEYLDSDEYESMYKEDEEAPKRR